MKVEMIATRDFTYNTRRLKAGDAFQARNRSDASILAEALGKATYGREIGSVEAPPARVMAKAEEAVKPRILTVKEVLSAEVVEKKPARKRKAKAKR